MSLRDKYAHAIQTCKGKFHGNAVEENGKLHFRGTVQTEAEKNLIWDAIKTVDSWRDEVIADITVTGPEPSSAPAGPAAKTYTVQPGDTLSKIARDHLGSATAYMKIFELNRDQLSDPDKIRPGQVLKLP